MTEEQQSLVRATFARVAPISDQAAIMFYDRLFSTNPELRALFKGDMAEQRRKLMTMIATAVGNLDRLGDIVPAVQALGRRHRGYGVGDADYGPVGAALLWTLDQALGPDFTPETREAWTVCYGILAGEMQRPEPAAA